MKRNRKYICLVFTMFFVMSMVMTAYAATADVAYDDFAVTLPSYSGDTEVSTVAKSSSLSYFIIIPETESQATQVRAWAESDTWGTNYSDPYKVVTLNKSTNVYYYASTYPVKGEYVVLNLDNPVYTTEMPYITGEWTPN